ncbi:predicted protein [Ostreococcus lucimarinus CCE9901]|uniref:Methyltransferase n=1 Tax=Ostreococcus lucimarinus (strain CCE9901) TaxID=436017 RepID=A4S1H5_OSTLU|nr:predicted protein [Ostreococcus lucimarinus CCE9901]ABO97661.1 predicted protein [Ostreococcus lucimarinus CCE9901]|eukprot:XP_001419368.1 predicted protein [Ostreococcus lucimarinus CCE9901]
MVDKGIKSYNEFFDQEDGKGVGSRILSTPDFVNKFYSLITDFYEYGWGESFHFAAREKGESFEDSIIRQEVAIAENIGLKAGMNVLDLGCGVGGPMRNIVKATGGKVTGITINEYQVGRCNTLNQQAGLEDLTEIVQGNFMDLAKVFKGRSFDGAYAIEAACHASNTTALYKQVFQVLKPGALFASYEWLRTDQYDPNNKVHVDVVDGIAEGNALPEVRTIEDCVEAAKAAGFDVQFTFDRATLGAVPWQQAMKSARRAAYLTHVLTGVLEFIGFAPKGTQAVHTMLLKAAVNLEKGGDLGIFSPMYLIVMKKPLAA